MTMMTMLNKKNQQRPNLHNNQMLEEENYLMIVIDRTNIKLNATLIHINIYIIMF